ncbi:MAG: bifunctional (p)ppGpp synthetase/guanosine-3',5'-bis(diphosphate) 3'-pyrophosphohydrolase [Bacteroidales bacterium]|nr:bifunctional (p)ppGpp synthetase/guanosine-3',5'-bis(diphosphate) 3'-pyrophosphohydrolase [Bacteroidales bacterium]
MACLPESFTDNDRYLVEKAYELAEEAHRPQKRKGGDPYIVHPIAVAKVVITEMRQKDVSIVCAALLHDVVEDTPHSIEEIRALFGDDVAFLVNAVTKRNNDQVDNYQHILGSVQDDVRVLILKLSDRLHNMRTLESMKPEKQWKIASETQFFFAPLAGRLGLFNVKSELENLAFRFLNPDEYDFQSWMLAEDRERTRNAVETFLGEVRELVGSVFGTAIKWDIRYRKPYSIWREMQERDCDFYHVPFKHFIRASFDPAEVERQVGQRLLEEDVVLKIYALLSTRYNEQTGSFVNYMAQPKANGYRSVHFRLLNPYGQIEEFHVSSDNMREQSYYGCIVEGKEQWLRRLTNVLRELSEDNDTMMPGIQHSLFNEDIVVFTPKGMPVTLPKNATVLDFAYEVHSDIGTHAKCAHVNGRLVSVRTVLHRGDCVRVETDEKIFPKPDWLDSTVSYKARKLIRSYLRDLPKPRYTLCPVCHPMPGGEIIGFRDASGVVSLHRRNCPEAIRIASGQGNTIVAVNDFEPNEAIVYPVCIQITAMDRYHLLRDIIHCVVEDFKVSIKGLTNSKVDEIFTCELDLEVHSVTELNKLAVALDSIAGVEEVRKQLK